MDRKQKKTPIAAKSWGKLYLCLGQVNLPLAFSMMLHGIRPEDPGGRERMVFFVVFTLSFVIVPKHLFLYKMSLEAWMCQHSGKYVA